MTSSHIDISDILGSNKIHINTPILVLTNVPLWYLVPVYGSDNHDQRIDQQIDRKIYDVDIDKLHNNLEKRVSFIDKFVPIGQVQINNRSKKTFDIILANTRIVSLTTNYEQIYKGVWVGTIRKNNKLSRSLGTIYSPSESPTLAVPVFPSSYLKHEDSDSSESEDSIPQQNSLYSHKSYGRWTLNPYKFNVDKSHLKMIDSAGKISSMFIPVTPGSSINMSKDLLDEIASDNIGKNYNRKVYYTTQGSVVNDTNCVSPLDNINKMTINECNAYSVNDSDLVGEDGVQVRKKKQSAQQPLRSNWFKRGKTLVLKEKDEPWFLDASIVGAVLHLTDPHKVTGQLNVIGTNYGDTDEIDMPFTSSCVTNDFITGYSRAEKDMVCRGKNKKHRKHNKHANHVNGDNNDVNIDIDIDTDTDDDSNIEQFSDDDGENMNYNNYIIYIMCIVLIILLIYRKH